MSAGAMDMMAAKGEIDEEGGRGGHVDKELLTGKELTYSIHMPYNKVRKDRIILEVIDMTDRLEVRLDETSRRKLAIVLADRRISLSAMVRSMIDHAYEVVCLEERRRAAEDLSKLSIEEVPDPQTLCRQLGEAYETTGLS